MILREYQTSDCKKTAKLFYNTVHTINASDYTDEQLNVWAGSEIDIDEWDISLKKNYTIVAVIDGIVVGFGDIDKSGYLDRLFVHKNYQRQGIATAVCDKLESKVSGKISTHASITARPFFENRGYKVIKEQQVERKGIMLTNFVMEKA